MSSSQHLDINSASISKSKPSGVAVTGHPTLNEPRKTVLSMNPSLATVNLAAPSAPQGRRRFLDYCKELNVPGGNSGLNNVAEVDEEGADSSRTGNGGHHNE